MELKKLFMGADNKKTAFFFGMVALGIVLTFLPGILSGHRTQGKDAHDQSLSEYITRTEERLCEVISGIGGAGKTAVFLNAESSFETVYASNATVEQSGADSAVNKVSQKSLVFSSDTGNGEAPVVVKTLCPKIGGVLVVCEGGMNDAIRQEILNAVSAAIGISQSKIYVTGGFHTS